MAFGVAATMAVYLTRALLASWGEFTAIISDPALLLVAGALSIAYGSNLFLLAGSWYLTLRQESSDHVPATRAALIYCIANIAKYLPGNVFHFVGRQLLGTRAGLGHRAIAQATLLEIAAIVASISLIILSAMAFGPSGAIESILPMTWRAGAEYEKPVAVAGLVGACFIFYGLARFRLFERLFGVTARAAARAITMCAVFFCAYVAMAMIFAHCLPAGSNAPSATTMGLVYLIAWLAGFVVPGAPGGLGVREAMLILLLTNTGETGRALALGLGFGMRIVSTLGDVIAVGLAYALTRLTVGYDAGRNRKAGCIR
jgi:uncharacterized membrane protein YbhN (UPF0104 family)